MNEKLARTMKHWLAEGLRAAEKFNNSVNEDGYTYALGWHGDNLFRYGARADVAREVLAILERGDDFDAFVECLREKLTEQLQTQSSSTCSNIAEVAKRNAIAEFVRDLKYNMG